MKYSSVYNPKSTASSQESAVTATANSNASNGSYEISITQLATNAMNIGTLSDETDLQTVIGEEHAGNYTFSTFGEDGEPVEHTFEITEDDTLNNVLNKISDASKGVVRAFYDESSNRVVLETTRTGTFNTDPKFEVGEKSPEIYFEDNSFFTNFLNLDMENETGGENAKFTYNNGLQLESKDNSYTLNGITFEFNNITDGKARITVNTDVEQSFESIMKFVDKYNEIIEKMNTSQMEERHRDFPPLTDEQMDEMTEKQIEQWEEKAKSGILRGESTIRDSMYSLRQSLQSKVETGGEFTLLSQLGITTTRNYLDGGKLEVDEAKLKEALRDHPDDVYTLFVNGETDSSRGLIHRFDDALDRTTERIEKQAGKSYHTLDNYTIGKQMKDLNERISDFERRMVQVEQRYWNQFTQMEQAISRLNQQSSYLFSQFGGDM